MMSECGRCEWPVDIGSGAEWEYMFRILSERVPGSRIPNDDVIVCGRCITHDEAQLATLLALGGYSTLGEWAADSGYTWHGRPGGGRWRCDGTGADVDIFCQALAAYEAYEQAVAS